jgi:outer membrane protein OmpA-like peptidoglycan-associated protein
MKKKSVELLTSNATGEFVPSILKGKNFGDKFEYKVTVSADSFLTQTFDLNVELGMDSIIKLKYLLTKFKDTVEIGPFIIYYDFDKSNIRPDAKIELDKVIKVMNENPTLRIELGSHTDSRGTFEYNEALAQRRAESASKYIKKNISTPSRITYKGYGESKLRNQCSDGIECTDEEHQFNRRTEFRIQK